MIKKKQIVCTGRERLSSSVLQRSRGGESESEKERESARARARESKRGRAKQREKYRKTERARDRERERGRERETRHQFHMLNIARVRLLTGRGWFGDRCRANMAHIRQSMPDSGREFQIFNIKCKLGDIRLWVGDSSSRTVERLWTFSCLVSLPH